MTFPFQVQSSHDPSGWVDWPEFCGWCPLCVTLITSPISWIGPKDTGVWSTELATTSDGRINYIIQ